MIGFFDQIEYDNSTLTDIFHSYKTYFDQALASGGFVTRKFLIVGSPRPELLSYQLYNDSRYYWVLLLLNNIYDPFYGWIQSEESVHQYATIKYQNLEQKHNTVLYHADESGAKHWRLTEYPIGSKVWYDIGDIYHQHVQYHGALVPITAVEHELNENEAKRVIEIITPSDMPKFLDVLTRHMEQMKYGY